MGMLRPVPLDSARARRHPKLPSEAEERCQHLSPGIPLSNTDTGGMRVASRVASLVGDNRSGRYSTYDTRVGKLHKAIQLEVIVVRVLGLDAIPFKTGHISVAP